MYVSLFKWDVQRYKSIKISKEIFCSCFTQICIRYFVAISLFWCHFNTCILTYVTDMFTTLTKIINTSCQYNRVIPWNHVIFKQKWFPLLFKHTFIYSVDKLHLSHDNDKSVNDVLSLTYYFKCPTYFLKFKWKKTNIFVIHARQLDQTSVGQSKFDIQCTCI